MRITLSDRQRAELVADLVALATGTQREALFRPLRGEAPVARARQVAMYLTHVSLGYSLSKVGKVFGRDKSTVAHAVHQIEDMRDSESFDDWLVRLEGALDAQSDLTGYPCAQQIVRMFPNLSASRTAGSVALMS